MQKDLHYYGTYTLARMAGLTKDAACVIAHASQFVDDSVKVDHKDIGIVTAHKALAIENTPGFRADQIQVWVPFHFLPGNEGKTFLERLVCTKESRTAQQMFEHYLELPTRHDGDIRDCILELVGIASHVYMDTFSHFGFAGICTALNRVDEKTIIVNNKSNWITNRIGNHIGEYVRDHGRQGGETLGFIDAAEAIIGKGAHMMGAIGHGPVGFYPDWPYLEWSYKYEISLQTEGGVSPPRTNDMSRNNYEHFFDGCKGLHSFLRRLSLALTNVSDGTGGVSFDKIAEDVKHLLSNSGENDDINTENLWRRAVSTGKWHGATEGETIPDYQPLYEEKPTKAENIPLARFYKAARFHKQYILNTLLPRMGLRVDDIESHDAKDMYTPPARNNKL
jgi:hypothetical protein